MDCTIGYSFDGKEVFVELACIEDADMSKTINYLGELLSEKHEGKHLKDLKGLSILIK